MLCCGALLVLTFPAATWEWLAWFGLVPGLVLIVRSPTAREGGVRAWWLGAGYLIAALYWMAPEIGPAVLLVAAVVGVLWVPFGVAARKLLRPPLTWPRALAALVVVPSCWLLTEWLRSWQALGGPWAVFGVSQWQHPAVLALAAVGGVWLISFALVLANVAIVLVIESLPRVGAGVLPGASGRCGAGHLGAAAALASVGAGPLAFALTPASPAVRQVTIAMVQPGIVSNAVQRGGRQRAADRRAEPLRRARRGQARPDRLGREQHRGRPDPAQDAASCARWRRWPRQTAPTCWSARTPRCPARATRSGRSWSARPASKGIYIKTRLVPFGEYIPFRQQLGWLTRISKAASSNMIPGTGAHLLYATDRQGRPLPIGVLICFESAFPDMSRVDTDLGAQLIVYQSATSTFQGTWGRTSTPRSARCARPRPAGPWSRPR